MIADTVNQEVEILVDGDMENAGVGDWNVGNVATLTKETGAVDDGTQVLRVAYNSSNTPYAYQILFTPGKTYRVTGWARGDGTYAPFMQDGAVSLQWVGTNSTSWQYFDVTGTAGHAWFQLLSTATGAGFAEFDDIMVTLYTPPIVNMEATVANFDDGDMEKAGVADWTAGGGATVSKETTNPHGGSRVLRVRGAQYSLVMQNIFTPGNIIYRVTGWVRGDGGTGQATVGGLSTAFYGTTSTDWQYFDITDTASDANILLYQYGNGGNDYAEFDDVFITEYTPPMVNDNVQLIDDGDMEDADGSPVSEWDVFQSTILTKETGWVDDGSQVLRITYDGGTSGGALQPVLEVGKSYRFTGWARGDDTNTPKIQDGMGDIIWTGDSAATWQHFDVSGTAGHANVYLQLHNGVAGYVEFDDVFVTETAPQYNNYGQLLVDGDMEVAETLGAELLVDNDMEEDGTDIFFSNKFDLTQAVNIAADSGSITGALTYACEGAEFDGTNDYVTYTVPSTLFSEKSSVSIVAEFTPDFAYDEDTFLTILDSTLSNRYLIYKGDNAGGNTLVVYLGDTTIALIPSATYSAYWKQNERNVLVISGTTGATNAWLNGTQILTNATNPWSPAAPTELHVGSNRLGTALFDGEIHAVSIYDGLLDGTDAQNIYDSVDTDDWTVGNNACLTKQLGAAESGSQVIRVAYDGTGTPNATQTILTASTRYRVTGWFKPTGGAMRAFLRHGTTVITYSTTTEEWQSFDETFTAGATTLQLAMEGAQDSAEFDDVTVKEITNDGADAWTPVNNAILSKESTNPHSGSLSMRIAYDDTGSPLARQSGIFTIGQEYRVTGWARGDGTFYPWLADGASEIWTGAISTAWQAFDVTFTAGGTTFNARSNATSAGYVEFDGVVVTRTD